MTKETHTMSAHFLKEFDPEFQRFLELVDRLESEIVRMQVAGGRPENRLLWAYALP